MKERLEWASPHGVVGVPVTMKQVAGAWIVVDEIGWGMVFCILFLAMNFAFDCRFACHRC